MALISRILENAERFPDKTAVITAEGSVSYREFMADVTRIASVFHDAEIGKNTHVTLLLNNSREFAAIMLAAADVGATIVPMNATIPAKALAQSMAVTDSRHIIGWHGVLDSLIARFQGPDGLRYVSWISVGGEVKGARCLEDLVSKGNSEYQLGHQDISADQPFILTMTSGSTGAPKPIVVSQATKINRVIAARDMYGLSDSDIVLAATPMYHSLAQRLVLLPLLIGGTSVIMTRFTAPMWLLWVEEHRVTFTIAVSAQLEMILNARRETPADLRSLHTIVSSSTLLKESVKRRLIDELECDFHESYGASELGIVSNLTPQDALTHMASVGCAAAGVDIKIVDDNGTPVPSGTVGEIAAKTKNRFLGYYGNDEATTEAMLGRFFHTGDLGYLDDDGFLYYTGRKKELIITGGINVYPKDVEEVLISHPKVRDCAVIGVEDVRLGETVLAVVEPKPGDPPNVRELQDYCIARLMDYQQPMTYKIVEKLPRNDMGKVMKRALVARCSGTDGSARVNRILMRR